MRSKSLKLFPVVVLIILLGLLAFGCGKQGNRFANTPPTISITSYEGYDPDNPYTDSTAVTLFQQRIFWHAYDPDGVVTGYAYRVLDENGNPVSTSGNSFIDSLGVVTPQNVLNQYGAGWVLHYQEGANQDSLLSSPDAKRTIWSSKKYATINFIAASANGDSLTTISRFEVICVDNRGAVCEQIAIRRFTSYSRKPTCFLSTTRGDPAGEEVGTGIRLSFTLDDDDPYIQPTAWYYKFKLQKVSEANNTVISEIPADGWVSTVNEPKINQFLMTKYTYPSLNSDFDSLGVQITSTRIIAKVVDLAGIESEADTIFFAVKEGFHPETIMHLKRVYALGTNHSIDYTDTTTPEVLPYTIVGNQQIFATPFFRDTEGYYTAVNSNNFKCWLRWGWHGEYGIQLPSGSVYVTDDPYDKKVDLLLDEDTDKNYFSEITHFDIRLNNAPYNYPPLSDSEVTDVGTGKKWLRVPVNSSLGQTIVLANLDANDEDNPYYFFEVRAVDLQGEVDPTPAEFSFKIVNPIPRNMKNGILIIDDEPNNNSFAPQDSVDARYYNMLGDYSGEVVLRRRTGIETTIDTDIRYRKFALSEIQRFKLIVYHADWPTQTSNFPIDQDAFALYLKLGGNMLVSAGGNLRSAVQATQIAQQQTMTNYFGIPYDQDATATIPGATLIANTWFVQAKSIASSFSDMNLAFDLNLTNTTPQPFYDSGQLICPDPNENYLLLLNTRKGLGPITYFKSYDTSFDANVTPLYKYGSKPVYPQPASTPPASNYYCPQTQASFDSANDKVVGLKKVVPGGSTCYIVGFPLSYMTRPSSKTFMSAVLTELGMF